MSIKIYDNLMPPEKFKKMYDTITNNNFHWCYNEKTLEESDLSDLTDFQFTHAIYYQGLPVSDYFKNITDLVDIINPFQMLKIKANLNVYGGNEIHERGFHQDITNPPVKVRTAVFYLNTNNGYTAFEDGEKVYSKQNRLVTFDCKEFHAGTTTTNAKARYVINLNYIANEHSL